MVKNLLLTNTLLNYNPEIHKTIFPVLAQHINDEIFETLAFFDGEDMPEEDDYGFLLPRSDPDYKNMYFMNKKGDFSFLLLFIYKKLMLNYLVGESSRQNLQLLSAINNGCNTYPSTAVSDNLSFALMEYHKALNLTKTALIKKSSIEKNKRNTATSSYTPINKGSTLPFLMNQLELKNITINTYEVFKGGFLEALPCGFVDWQGLFQENAVIIEETNIDFEALSILSSAFILDLVLSNSRPFDREIHGEDFLAENIKLSENLLENNYLKSQFFYKLLSSNHKIDCKELIEFTFSLKS